MAKRSKTRCSLKLKDLALDLEGPAGELQQSIQLLGELIADAGSKKRLMLPARPSMTHFRDDEGLYERMLGGLASDEWLTVGELVQRCEDRQLWPLELTGDGIFTRTAFVRQLVLGARDNQLWPVWARLTDRNEIGDKQLFKVEERLTAEDYGRLVAAYRARWGSHARKMAAGYAERCRRRYGIDPPEPEAEAENETPCGRAQSDRDETDDMIDEWMKPESD